MKTLLVSADPRVRDAFLALQTSVKSLGEVRTLSGTLQDWLRDSRGQQADMLVVDAQHPDPVLAALPAVMSAFGGQAVVMLVGSATPEILLQALRTGVREVLALPLNAAECEAAFQRLASRIQPAQAGGKVLAFAPCKGGAGASFIAANLGHALAAASRRPTLLIDFNLHFGDALLTVSERTPAATVSDLLREASRLDAWLLRGAVVEVAEHFSALAAPEHPAEAADIRPGSVEVLLQLARSHFDHVLLDVPRTLDPVTLACLDGADQIYPVLQQSVASLRHARRMLEVFAKLNYPPEKVRPILNRTTRGAPLTREDSERALGRAVFASLPNDWSSATQACNQGVPLAVQASGSALARALRELALRILDKPAAPSGLLARLRALRPSLARAS